MDNKTEIEHTVLCDIHARMIAIPKLSSDEDYYKFETVLNDAFTHIRAVKYVKLTKNYGPVFGEDDDIEEVNEEFLIKEAQEALEYIDNEIGILHEFFIKGNRDSYDLEYTSIQISELEEDLCNVDSEWGAKQKESLHDQLESKRSTGIIKLKYCLEQIHIDYLKKYCDPGVVKKVTDIQRISERVNNAELFFKENNISNELVTGLVRQARENCVWSRARKKLNEAKVAEEIGNIKKASKLKTEAWIFFKQDWIVIYDASSLPIKEFEVESGKYVSNLVETSYPQEHKVQVTETVVAEPEVHSINIPELLVLAEHGDAEAQYKLGKAYDAGRGVEQDYQNAAKWYQKSAELGYLNAQYNLAVLYENGDGVSKDIDKAFFWFSKAAEQGDPEAQCNIGTMYADGTGVSRDLTSAIEWYSKAAMQNYAEAMNHLGAIYEKGDGIDVDMLKAVEWYTKAAELGYAVAQSNLGMLYSLGNGVPKDPAIAIAWLRKSADQGCPEGQLNLGLQYETGEGVRRQLTTAFQLYKKAADQNLDIAQNNLAVLYENGRGVQRDPVAAAEWYTKAAEQGNSDAQFNLGCLYEAGKGVKKDLSIAAKWYTRAAESGDLNAQCQLGFLYYEGRGVLKDIKTSAMWTKKAAEQGDANAQYNLGVLYELGEGVEPNTDKALEWYRKAALQGERRSQRKVSYLSRGY